MKRLTWSDGTRSAAEGTDLAAVARTLSDAELEFWIERFRANSAGGDLWTLHAEARRRSEDWEAGPLFRNAE